MADLIKAAADARVLLRGFQSLQVVADALEEAGKAQQHVAEAQKALGVLQGQIDAAKADLEAAKGQARDLLADAKAKSEKLLADAKAKSEKLVYDAVEREAAALLAVEETRRQMTAMRVDADDDLGVARTRRDALLAECAELEARIDKVQKQVAKLLGA